MTPPLVLRGLATAKAGALQGSAPPEEGIKRHDFALAKSCFAKLESCVAKLGERPAAQQLPRFGEEVGVGTVLIALTLGPNIHHFSDRFRLESRGERQSLSPRS